MLVASPDRLNQHDPMPNSDPGPPAEQQQRRKRRSAAERRASHRRRSSAAHDRTQLAQLLNGLQKSAGTQEGARDCSPSGYQTEEPPEPAVPAPGEEEEEGQEHWPDHGQDCWLDGPPRHQRSVSDHLLLSVQSAQRRLPFPDPPERAEFVDDQLDGPMFSLAVENNNQSPAMPQLASSGKKAAAGIARKAPMLVHIRRQQQQQKGETGTEDEEQRTGADREASGSGPPPGSCPQRQQQHQHQFCNGGTVPSPSSSGLGQLLVDRFGTRRQHSDSNLLRRLSQRAEEPAARRSFKWKSLWGRRGAEPAESRGTANQQQTDDGEKEYALGGECSCSQLGSVPEDEAETGDQQPGERKRHSAVVDSESPGPARTVRLRTTGSQPTGAEGTGGQRRPFSVIGAGARTELADYRVREEDWGRLQRFLRERTAEGGRDQDQKARAIDDWEEEEEEEGEGDRQQRGQGRKDRAPRTARQSPLSWQTLGRTAARGPRLQRAVSSRPPAGGLLTLPRAKKGVPRGPIAQQRRRQLQSTAQLVRRKSVLVPPVDQPVLLAKAGGQEGATQKRASVSTSSLRQLLVASAERSRAKRNNVVAPKAELARTTDREKKREGKANSVILGIWSIRQRRKKETTCGGQRSIAALFGQSPRDQSSEPPLVTENAAAQSPLSSPLSPPEQSIFAEQPPFPRPQLELPMWEDLSLWAEREPSWTARFGAEAKGLSTAEKKRQNVIYELVQTERHHCQVLVLLRQLYRHGLLRSSLVTEKQLDQLIPPGVLDPLLDFHLGLLRALCSRCARSPVVPSVADILLDQFQASPFRSSAVRAYIAFCLAREDSHRTFAAVSASSQQFRKFLEFHESGQHKQRSFKACMLLVAQRLTKYPVLAEQMAKLEPRGEQKRMAEQAHLAVKEFARSVDQGLHRHEVQRKWLAVRTQLDKAGSGKMVDPRIGREFTFEDLVKPMGTEDEQGETEREGEGPRRVLLVARVFWRETVNGPDVELLLLLCDDVIVLLRPKGAMVANGGANCKQSTGGLHFFRHSAHAGILPLSSTLIRGENSRRKSLMLIVTAKERPDLFGLAFASVPELEQCAEAIKSAKLEAPKFVRLANERKFVLTERPIGEETDWEGRKAERAEKESQRERERWTAELERLFEERAESEAELGRYLDKRMDFIDTLRAHLERMPFGQTEEEANRLKATLRARLEGTRKTGKMEEVVERAQLARDGDLLEEVAEGEEGGQTAAAGSSSAEDRDSSAEGHKGRRPRRVSTYHGGADHQKQRQSGSSGSSAGIRRHTTVPGPGALASSEEEDPEERGKRQQQLALGMGPAQRKAAAELIRENVRLRAEVARLKAEAALRELQLIALRERRETEKDGANGKSEVESSQAETEQSQQIEQKQASEEPEPAKWDSSPSACPAGPPSSNAPLLRPVNTYCGAGPVPSSRSNGQSNTPAIQLGTERRAISQTELPRHLAVKTETRQRRK